MTQFEKEQNELLETMVFNYIYPRFKYDYKTEKGMRLELFLSSKCNKNCEYCYLQKNKNELYPQEFDNYELILKNTKILFEHLFSKEVSIHTLDLFSGEFLGTDFGFNFLDLILSYSKKLDIKRIIIASNANFLIEDQIIVDKMEKYFDNFKEQNIFFHVSISDDGLLLDDINRPLQSKEKQNKDLFYKRAKYFCQKYGFTFHPMVNAYSIEKWVDNLKWWEKYCLEVYNEIPIDQTMFLEVRNDEWTDEKIEAYLLFLKSLMESPKKYYKNISSLDMLFFLYQKKRSEEMQDNNILRCFNQMYQPYYMNTGAVLGCSISHSFIVRLGDLSICPCHRLSYDHLLYGKYLVENNKIIGIKANNVEFFANNYILGYKGIVKCDTCVIKDMCLKGCKGTQYEINKDPNIPVMSVCNFMKVKALYLCLNLIYWTNKLNCEKYFKNEIEKATMIIGGLKNENEEFFNKWKKIIYQNLLEI